MSAIARLEALEPKAEEWLERFNAVSEIFRNNVARLEKDKAKKREILRTLDDPVATFEEIEDFSRLAKRFMLRKDAEEAIGGVEDERAKVSKTHMHFCEEVDDFFDEYDAVKEEAKLERKATRKEKIEYLKKELERQNKELESIKETFDYSLKMFKTMKWV